MQRIETDSLGPVEVRTAGDGDTARAPQTHLVDEPTGDVYHVVSDQQ